MALPSWADNAQTAWLHGLMADFMRRQAEGKLHLFWPPMLEAYVAKWPEHGLLNLPLPNDPSARKLTQDELAIVGAAIQKLENWFQYQRKKIGAINGTAPSTTGAAVRNMFKLNAPKHRRRAHQAIEVFQKRNRDKIRDTLTAEGYDNLNEEKMADDVDDWTNESEDSAAERLKATKSEHMRLRTHMVQALWAEADTTEREAVEKEVEREKQELREEELREETLGTAPKATLPWELQDGIDALDGMYADVHKATYNASGWVGMSIMGGLNPRMGGELSMKIVCFGQTAAGNDFEDLCMDFNKNVLEAIEAFLRNCYIIEKKTGSRRRTPIPSNPNEACPRRRLAHTCGTAQNCQ
ncbi:hypothetical protein B0H10DRAFT_1960067 [Mycena sp. CBHHK59/15]|nr:hypothetical protein B0H10DRAFT_1960067 [Mycena sp. CBHHK59/15]